jgi:hypothetical protein
MASWWKWPLPDPRVDIGVLAVSQVHDKKACEALVDYLKRNKTLRTLHYQCSTSDVFRATVSALHGNDCITELSCPGRALTDDDFVALGAALCSMRSLTKLDVSANTSVSAKGVAALAEALGGHPSLKVLDAHDCKFPVGELARGLLSNTSVEQLLLRYCDMRDVQALCKALHKHPALRVLDLSCFGEFDMLALNSLTELVGASATLCEVHFYFLHPQCEGIGKLLRAAQHAMTFKLTGQISDMRGSKLVADGLRDNKHITGFKLCCQNHLGDTLFKAIGDALKTMPNLKELEIPFNDLHSDEHLVGLTGLTRLDLGWNPCPGRFVATLVEENSALKVLKLERTEVTEASAITIFKALQNHPAVTELHLFPHCWGVGAVEAFADLLSSNSRVCNVTFREGMFSVAQCVELGRALETCSGPLRLRLESSIEAGGDVPLLQGLGSSRHIYSVDFDNNPLSPELLTEAVTRCTSLQELRCQCRLDNACLSKVRLRVLMTDPWGASEEALEPNGWVLESWFQNLNVRNHAMHTRCRAAVLTLLCMARFGHTPFKDVLKNIAQHVWETRAEIATWSK